MLNFCHLKRHLLVKGLPFTNMDRLTTEKRIKIVKTYLKSGDSNVVTFQALGDDPHNRTTMASLHGQLCSLK